MIDVARSVQGGAVTAALAALAVLFTSGAARAQLQAHTVPVISAAADLALPPPRERGRLSLEATLAQRRSMRSFASTPLTAAQAGQLLWAAQGLTDASGDASSDAPVSAQSRRTAPSAGATYPLALYLVAGGIDGVASGVYRYLPQGHRLQSVSQGDVRSAVAAAAHGQRWIADAPALVVIVAQPARTVARYGARAERYVAMESGAAAQNLLLQAVALDLGGALVGAFDEAALRRCLALVDAEQPLAVVPVGNRR